MTEEATTEAPPLSGEILTLRQALLDALHTRNEKAQGDVLKRVVLSMVSGHDMSEMMDSVVMASRTNNMSHKKMIFLYMQTYARHNPSSALMAVGSFLSDCHASTPAVKGMALRSLCSMLSPELAEHMIKPIEKGLQDPNSSVRQIAIIAVAKLNSVAPTVINNGIISYLTDLIVSSDTRVNINALRVIDELYASKGGYTLNRQIMIQLLSKIQFFSPWNQCYILEHVAKYEPTSAEELIGLMNLLDSRLATHNSGIIFACVQIFLKWTRVYPEYRKSVYYRIRHPILSLLSGTIPEIEFSIISHISALSEHAPGLFKKEFKYFYVCVNDPEYLKIAKVQLLASLASPTTTREIISEMEGYLLYKERTFVLETISALGRLAYSIPNRAAEPVLSVFLACLDLVQLPFLISNVIIMLRDLVRRFPDMASDVIHRLPPFLQLLHDVKAKASIVYLLGLHGNLIMATPYILEKYVNAWSSLESSDLKNQIFMATLRMFFKSPQEILPALQKLFVVAMEDYSDPDIHDRVTFYYRLLLSNIEKCRVMVTISTKYTNIEPPPIQTNNSTTTTTAATEENKENDFVAHFNTLAAVYQQPPGEFIKAFPTPKRATAAATAAFSTSFSLQGQSTPAFRRPSIRAEQPKPLNSAPEGSSSVAGEGEGAESEVGKGERGEDGGEQQEPLETQEGVETEANTEPEANEEDNGDEDGEEVLNIELSPEAKMDQQTFERLWGSLAGSPFQVEDIDPVTDDVDAVADLCGQYYVQVLAKAQLENGMRLFVYAQKANTNIWMVAELVINLTAKVAIITVRCTQEDAQEDFELLMETIVNEL